MRLLRTLSYMARIISVTMAATLLLLSAPHAFAIEDPPVFFYNELYKMNEDYWQLESSSKNWHPNPATSINPIVGVNWKVCQFAFQHNSQLTEIKYLLGGPKLAATTPWLQTADKITVPVAGIAMNIDVNNNNDWELVKSALLTISPNSDMTDGTSIEAEIPSTYTYTGMIIFNIPDPMPDMYYRIDLALERSGKTEGWFYLKELRFALPESTKDLPDFSYVDNPASGKYTVNLSASEGRELHVMWGKYNSLNEPMGNCFEENSSLMSGPERAADIIKDPSKAWANKEESPYSKTFDVSSPFGEYYVLRAKTRRNGDPTDQSNEIVKVISKSGIVTGIDDIVDNSNVQPDGEDQWFNMQGMRISRPETPGIYVRVRDGKSSKIML